MTFAQRIARLIGMSRATFLRLLALAFAVFALVVWGQLLGFDLGWTGLEGTSFDALGQQQRVASVVLAVMLPLSATGLWSLAAWGQVVWGMTITVHVIALARGWEGSAYSDWLLAFHAVTLAVYIVLSLGRLATARMA